MTDEYKIRRCIIKNFMRKLIFFLFIFFLLSGSAFAQQSTQPEETPQPVTCPVCVDLFGNQIQEGCMIKGNINSKGDKIYHCPLWRDYDKTDIDESKGERWFFTEAEAREAGWRSPKYNTGPCRLIK